MFSAAVSFSGDSLPGGTCQPVLTIPRGGSKARFWV